MDKRIANLYLTAQRAGVCLDGPPPDSQPMLQAVVYLCQALGLPLQYRFLPTPIGPLSDQLSIDQAAYCENPQRHRDETAGMVLRPTYGAIVDQVRKLKSMVPNSGDALPWMQTAAHIHMTSQTRGIGYADAAQTLAKTNTAVALLMVPVLYVMDNCGFKPQPDNRTTITNQIP